MNLTKNFASRRQSCQDSQQDRTKIFAIVNLLLGKNLGKICGSIPATFWQPGLMFPGENLGKIRSRIAPRFWPLGFFLLARILARFAAGSRRDFGHREFHFLARILPGSRQDSCWEEKSRQPKSCRDPTKILVLILQGFNSAISFLYLPLFRKINHFIRKLGESKQSK